MYMDVSVHDYTIINTGFIQKWYMDAKELMDVRRQIKKKVKYNKNY